MFTALQERTRTEEHAPDFPGEVSLTSAAVPVAAAAPKAKKQQLDYQPADVPLEAITDSFTVLCSASPDAGWPVLKEFLSRIQNKLVVGLYDFTSAHVLETVQAALTAGGHVAQLALVLDDPKRNPTADQSDPQTEQALSGGLDNALSFAWAAVRSSPMVHEWVFPTAYHIKVAVRDRAELWLSSGNWNNSNQPENAPSTDPNPQSASDTFKKSDRDWHVVIAHPKLAELFEA
jgi:hypothetical protein